MESKFTKTQLLESNEFRARQDALSVVLMDDKTYTKQEVKRLLKQFYNKGVK